VSLGDTVLRRYAPAEPDQTAIVMPVYSSQSADVRSVSFYAALGLLLLTFPWSVGRSVSLSVCDVTTRYPAKTVGPIEMPFGMWGGVGHSHRVLDGVRIPRREGAILR